MAEQNGYFVDEPVFGGQAYVVEAGNKNRPLLVLVHGLGDVASDTWQAFIPKLAKDFHVLTFDLPGFGRSSKANKLYSPDNYVDFIDFLVKRSGQKKLTLIGHSMGGNIALRYATTYPQKVRRLMLVDAAGVLHRLTYASFFTHFGISLVPEFYPGQSRDIASLAGLLINELARQQGMLETGEQFILTQPALRQKVLGGNPSAIAAYAMVMADYSDRLSSLKTPTLIVWGRDDNVIPLRTGRVLATQLRDAGLVIINDAGHVPMRDKPLIFSGWLRRFVSGSDAEVEVLLKQKRYQIDARAPNGQRVGTCKNQQGTSFDGDYLQITIENCRDVVIDSAHLQTLTIRNSTVVINNSYIKNTDRAILVEGSTLQINGSTVSGQPAIEFKDSDMDIAGSELLSRDVALLNRDEPDTAPPPPGPLGRLRNDATTIIFSVSSLHSRYFDKTLHGPVQFKPGQAW